MPSPPSDALTPQERSDSRTHKALADESRVRILSLLRQSGPLDVRALAQATGLHPSTVRGHLELLVEAGFASAAPEQRRTRGRPRTLYRATQDAPLTEEADGYRLLAGILASHLAGTSPDPSAAAVTAGEAWGRYLAEPAAPFARTPAAQACEQLLALLERLGFRPEADDGGDAIRLRHCPFLAVARAYPQVVCGIHLGLMRGALAAWGAPVTTGDLEPFAEPAACLAHLSAEAS